MKEYQKLLLEADHRRSMEKALTMVELGLFDDKGEIASPDMDFSNLEEITIGKLYKGVFHLYEDQTTGDLFFVNPLVEDNKGDSKAERVMEPYAYQVLAIESVTEDEYLEILKASQTERSSFIKFLYRTEIVVMIISVVAALLYFIDQVISLSQNYSVGLSFYYALGDYMLSSYCLIGIQLGVLVLTSIFYRKFRKGM